MYFGTNGVRGKFDQLTPELTLKLAQAIGIYLKNSKSSSDKVGEKPKIIVARDCRMTGELLQSIVMGALASVGCDVLDIGIASSPTAEFMIKTGAAGCIIVSASHNPPEWNALKVVDGFGVAISHERGGKIEKLMEKISLAKWDDIGKITKYDRATLEHIEAIGNAVNREAIAAKRPKIVLDCGNGTACVIAPKLFKELGCEILTLNSHPDGKFPGRASEPSEGNVKDLVALVQSSGANAGVAWDGDGDRVIFVDEKGGYVIGDKVFALSIIWKFNSVLARGDVVTTVATSKAVEDVAKSYGGKIRYTAIGAPYLCEEMIKKPAAIGGEEVGGVIFPEFSLAKDGFLTAAKMVEAICQKPLSNWLELVPKYYNIKTKIDAKNEKTKKQMIARVLKYAKSKKLDYIDIDGVRINMKESWVIVRPSGTEPYVRIFAEAKGEEEAKRLVKEYEGVAKQK